MPTMANITVKKADGTTDVIYVASTPSAGDKSPAIWTLNTASGIQGYRPRFELWTQNNAANSIRQARFKYSFPSVYTDTTTGLQKLNKSVGFEGVVYLPKELTTTEWKEAWAQLGNLCVSTLVRSSIEEGFAPT